MGEPAASTGVRATVVFGVAALACGLGYDITQILDVIGVFHAPWGLFAIVLPSLFLAWSYAALVSVLHSRSGETAKPWTQLALTFAILYAGLNSIVYPVQLAVVVPQALAGGEGLSSQFAMAGGRPLTAVNAVAYALLSLSAFFLSFSYPREHGGRFAPIALIAHGALAPVILAILYVPALLPVGGLWIVTFPLAMIAIIRRTRRG
jgi:hypothetical protein